jgi:hypothetical protein
VHVNVSLHIMLSCDARTCRYHTQCSATPPKTGVCHNWVHAHTWRPPRRHALTKMLENTNPWWKLSASGHRRLHAHLKAVQAATCISRLSWSLNFVAMQRFVLVPPLPNYMGVKKNV